MKILVPNTIELQLGSDAEVVVYDVSADIPAEHRDAEVLVTWQNPGRQLDHAVRDLPELRLVQTLAAGPDAVLAAGFAADVRICSGRSLHDGPVAEHALALILGRCADSTCSTTRSANGGGTRTSSPPRAPRRPAPRTPSPDPA